MPHPVIKYVRNWSKRSEREENQHKLVFLDRNIERYDWDNSDLDDNAVNTKKNSPLKDLPA